MDKQETQDENSIRHYKGTVKQFKQMFDDLADGKDTNAYDSPVRQGYDVHPTRDEDNKSPHWDEEYEDELTQNENHIPTFESFLNEAKSTDGLGKDAMEIYRDLDLQIGLDDPKYTIRSYKDIDPAIKAHKLYKKLTPREIRILGNALGNVMRIRIRMER